MAKSKTSEHMGGDLQRGVRRGPGEAAIRVLPTHKSSGYVEIAEDLPSRLNGPCVPALGSMKLSVEVTVNESPAIRTIYQQSLLHLMRQNHALDWKSPGLSGS